jgi:type III pantothenate kinase
MDIVVDFGNTSVKLGIVESDQIKEVVRFDSQHIDLKKFEDVFVLHKPERICFLTVTAIEKEIIDIFHRYATTVIQFSHSISLPFAVHYHPPTSLGLDRLAGIVGARALFPETDLLVIQAGTCITYDFYFTDKGFVGGAISPGTRIRNKALNTFTYQLPFVDEPQSDYPDIIADHTIGSIQSGIYNGAYFEMIGFIEFAERQSKRLKVIISGGDMSYFVNKIKKNRIFANPNLTLLGLNVIIKLNE